MKTISLLVSLLFSLTTYAETKSYQVNRILALDVDSSINPAIFNYLDSGLNKTKNGDLILIRMDTPGGLVSTTKDIITAMGKSDVPIVVWITPSGASATSAGAIISSAAHVLVMSEGANIGAATPVGIGKDIDKKSDGRKKAINDLVALVSSLAKAHGRNEKKFSLMISEASSFDSQTALKEKIIDGIVNTDKQLLSFLNSREVKLKGQQLSLDVGEDILMQQMPMDLGLSLLNILAHPTTAYILFVIGAALLYFEMQAPGGFIAGGVGLIALIFAGIGFQVLPLNMGALGLIVLSFFLFILEAYITSYGILTFAGLASLVAGSLFLFRTDNSYLTIETSLVIAVSAAIALYVLVIGFLIVKNWNNKESFFQLKGAHAEVLKLLKEKNGIFHYQVKVAGEIWNASSKERLEPGEEVLISTQNAEKMDLTIVKKPN